MKKTIKTIIIIFILTTFLTGCNFFSSKKGLSFYVDYSLYEKISSEGNEALTFPSDPEKEGYSFKGWYISTTGEKIEETTFENKSIDSTIILTAQFEAIKYDIIYVLNGGTATNPATYTIEDEITITNPTKQGATFKGWSEEGVSTFNKNLVISKGTTGNKKYIANYSVNTYSITFDSNGGTEVLKISKEGGKAIVEPTPPIKIGYKFEGWYLGKEKYTFEQMPYKSITLVAKWSLVEYTISFKNNDMDDIKYTIEDEIRIPNPIKEGYEFIGWGSDKDKDILIKNSHENIELESFYQIKEFTITFESNGGSNVSSITQEYNTLVSKPTDPTKTSDTFLGWYSDSTLETPYAFTTMKESIILYAKWQNTGAYLLTYGENVTCNVENNTYVFANAKINLYADYVIDGYVFDGWYNGETILSHYNSYTLSMPEKNYEVNAKYIKVTTYTYDKYSNSTLTIPKPSPIYGEGISSSDYTTGISKVILKPDYLCSLVVNTYSFFINGELIYIKITDSSSEVKNLRVDYDINFPKVTLLFDEKASLSYTYSIDGSTYVKANSGMIIDFDKEADHEITVKCGTKEKALEIKGYVNTLKDYYTNHFTNNGNTYDFYIEDEEDFEAFIDYAYSVYAVTESTYDAINAKHTASLSFIASEEYSSKITIDLISQIIKQLSVSYSFQYSLSIRESVYTVKADVYGTFNTLKTTQEKTILAYTLEESLRGDAFNDFYIEALDKVEEITTLYELENLSNGVRPIVIDETALKVYNKAKEILRKYVDDSMSDYEKAKVIYDWLAINVTYDDAACVLPEDEYFGNYASFTSYGALVNNVAVCDGIASAYKLLCQIEGIEAVEVSGTTYELGHAWNKIKIDGVWYGVDATWSRVQDQNGNDKYFYHAYFLCNEYYLYNTDHFEAGTSVLNRVTGINIEDVANSACQNYYELQIYGGYDLYVSSKAEVISIYDYCKSIGIKSFEIYYEGSYFSSFFNSLSYTKTGFGNYVLITVS